MSRQTPDCLWFTSSLAGLLLGCATAAAPGTPTSRLPADSPASRGEAGTSLPTLPGASAPSALPGGGQHFESLEGPYWVGGAGGHLLFSDVVEANAPGAKIYRFDPRPSDSPPSPGSGQFSIVRYPGSTPTSTNGLAVDGRGALVACERYNARVIRVEGGSKLTVLAERWPVDPSGGSTSSPLGAPNDLAIRADGNIYFTDSDWGAKPGVVHAAMGIYRIDPAGKLSRVLDLDKPNGIALAPDGAFLYVGSDTQAKVWRLPLDAQGSPGIPKLFIDGPTVPGGFKVPDGICVDDAGDLYVTNNDDAIKAIIVFDASGKPKARLPFPERPSNCSFGGDDRKTLYVTTLHAIYQVRVPTAGLP